MREYAERVVRAITENNGVLEAEIAEVVKMNDEINVGVKVQRKGDNFGSIHYVQGYIESGISAEDCAKEVVERVMATTEIEFTEESKLTWEENKGFITMRLLNKEYNEKYLADKVYKDLGNGLAIMFDITKGDYRAAVTTSLAEDLGCDLEMLVGAAEMNTSVTPVLYDLAEKIFVERPTNLLESNQTSHASMLVLTMSETTFGAVAIYRGVNENIKEAIGEYYLLPSSVHEWIVVPESTGIPVSELCKMVEGANHTAVDRQDLLSYGVYKWTESGLNRVA